MIPISIAAMRRGAPWAARVALSLVAALVACTLAATVALANPPLLNAAPREGPSSWGVEISGGLNSYDLSAVNDSLQSLNQAVGTVFGSIRQGSDFGAALRCWASPPLLLRLHLEKHSASASGAGNRYDIGSWNARIGATYFFPSGRRLRLGAGLAAGITRIRGRFTGPQFAFDTRGSGPDLRATGEAMCPLGRDWFASGSAGLRYAHVSDIQLGKQSTNTPAEFSGFILRMAVGRDWPRFRKPN